jgi:hypothetical protein
MELPDELYQYAGHSRVTYNGKPMRFMVETDPGYTDLSDNAAVRRKLMAWERKNLGELSWRAYNRRKISAEIKENIARKKKKSVYIP